MEAYGTDMEAHRHRESPWRVQVCASDGTGYGAGVLLDGRYVLTCAHVIEQAAPDGENPEVRVDSVACDPRWDSTATVVPGTWTARGETRRGDVALLKLANSPGCGASARLRPAVEHDQRVRAFGFPHRERTGQWSEGKVAGPSAYDDWIQLWTMPGVHPISKGYSGAGVIDDDGEVVGIAVEGFVDTEHQGTLACWMLPVEKIIDYIPFTKRYTRPHDEDAPGSLAQVGDAARSALAREVHRLFTGDWYGTVVVTGGGTRAVRSWPVDLTVDAAGRKASEVWGPIAGRYGVAPGDREPARTVLRHRSAVSLLVNNIDAARDQDALLRDHLVPLAEGAQRRRARLVLGFEGGPPPTLPHEVSLGMEPVQGSGLGPADRQGAERAVERLAAVEDGLAGQYDAVSYRIVGTPVIPPRLAPRLRIRLAATASGEAAREVSAIRDRADAAVAEASRLDGELAALHDRRDELRDQLDVLRARVERRRGAKEDLRLEELYAKAHDVLYRAPCDLRAAARLVWRYHDEAGS